MRISGGSEEPVVHIFGDFGETVGCLSEDSEELAVCIPEESEPVVCTSGDLG